MSDAERERVKKEIVGKFRRNVRGVVYERLSPSSRVSSRTGKEHSGSEGHWLERQFGIRANSRREADYKGFELKKPSARVNVGDYSAHEYIYDRAAPVLRAINGERHLTMRKEDFIKEFGAKSNAHDERFAWTGRSCPKYNAWSFSGQCLVSCPSSGNIYAVYSHNKDRRTTAPAVPDAFKVDYLAIAVWYASKLREDIENKWNKRGFFMPLKCPRTRAYKSVQFGRPFGYEYFLDAMRRGTVIFDSGMVTGSSRNCSKFRVRSAYSSPFFKSILDGEPVE